MVSTVLALVICMLKIEIMVEMVGLAKKVDIVLIAEVETIELVEVTKIDVEGSVFCSVDEVFDTSVNVVLS